MRFLLALTLALGLGSVASAVPITFTSTGTGSGSIGATNFTDAAFTITAFGDTTARQDLTGGVFAIVHTSAQIDIAGVGVFDFTIGTRTFVNQGNPVVGFSRASGLDLYDGPIDAQFSTWDMLTAIGPVAGNIDLVQWNLGDVSTTGGVLFFNAGTTPGTFQAELGGAVPEPTTWLMLFGGLAVTAVLNRRSPRRG